MNKALISEIVAMEWEMFQNVPNAGGRAACQNKGATFKIMRTSQLTAWSEPLLESYKLDLQEAQVQGRNLLTEKYANMMAWTDPEDYAKIAHLLPELTPAKKQLIVNITKIHMEWVKEMNEKYPYVREKGRPASSQEDSAYKTSVETYMQGELATYSLRTLELYMSNICEQQSQNINGAQIVLEATVKAYGYTSLDVANKALAPKN